MAPLRLNTRCFVTFLISAYLIFVTLHLARPFEQVALNDDANASLLQPQDSLRRALGDNHSNSSRQNLRKFRTMRFIRPFDDVTASLPPPQQRAPNFIIIGSQKSGTTALNSYLSQHPLIEIPSEFKEPHFFDLYFPDGKTPKENLNTYVETYFDRDCRRAPCISGESTPIYLYDTPVIPSVLRETCPWVKLIVLLRDPIERVHSQHNMLVDEGFLDNSFEQHLEDDFHWMKMVGLYTNKTLSREEEDLAWNRYLTHPSWQELMLGRGLYEIQLRQYFQHFDRSQFLILKSHDLDVNQEATMKKVYAFLGIPYQALVANEKVHVRHYDPMPAELERRLYDFYRPYNKRLEQLLGSEWKGCFTRRAS